jgi:trk system potassium uptake protein TrkH
MHFSIIARILGLLLMLFSLTMLVPLFVSIFYQDGAHLVFLTGFAITLSSGLAMWAPVRNKHEELRHRDGFLITSLFWIVLGLFGSLPFLLSATPNLTITDAVFESISGLTTTGATVITGLDYLPKSILYYRQQLQWLGGIGIIVIAVAILPMLGIGGMQLYRAETPGPVKDRKLTPRIAGTAKWIFFIYFTLTFVCAGGYWLAGMSLFDAIGHSFSTIAIGGFSTHDASMGYFESPVIKTIAIFFMFISGINFALHYYAWRQIQVYHYIADSETTFYFFMMLLCGVVVVTLLIVTGTYGLSDALIEGMFQTVSIATTTGFASTDFASWPNVLPFWLLFFAFIGGCGGSTGGGLKAIRVLLIVKQGIRELRQLIHPNATIPIKLKNHTVSDRVMTAVWSFFSIYIFCFLAIIILLLLSGLDYITAFSATAATINNLGPGLGEVSAHYGNINDFSKWVLCVSMLLGRLEIFTLLVLFTPEFWRR